MNRNSIEIYVRSSPLGSNGIHWRNVSKAGQPIEEPEVLKSRVVYKSKDRKATINSLINDTKPSIILARYGGKILLEVTGLEASEERSAQLGRRITDVVLWVGNDSEEVESQLRQLAALAILNIRDKDSHFLKVIRDAVQFENLNDFRVDQGAIEGLFSEDSREISLLSGLEQGDSSIWSPLEKSISDAHLDDLARKISQTALPETENPIVVVAEVKGEYLDYRGDVWREAPPQTDTAIVPGSEEDPKKKLPNQPEAKPFHSSRLSILVVIVAAAALVFITINLLPKPTNIPPTPPPFSTHQEEIAIPNVDLSDSFVKP
jgi:uncharacterized protein YaeQ